MKPSIAVSLFTKVNISAEKKLLRRDDAEAVLRGNGKRAIPMGSNVLSQKAYSIQTFY